jgi:hypothetical protein
MMEIAIRLRLTIPRPPATGPPDAIQVEMIVITTIMTVTTMMMTTTITTTITITIITTIIITIIITTTRYRNRPASLSGARVWPVF